MKRKILSVFFLVMMDGALGYSIYIALTHPAPLPLQILKVTMGVALAVSTFWMVRDEFKMTPWRRITRQLDRLYAKQHALYVEAQKQEETK